MSTNIPTRPAKRNIFLATLASTAIVATLAFTAAPASAQVNLGIYVRQAPPPIRYEARPGIPGPGYVWVDGFWEPYRNQYRWHPGYWNQPPFAGAYYVHPHYDHYNEGWRLHEGYWAHEDHDDHHWDNRRDNRQDKRRDDHRDDHRDDRPR